MNEEGIKNFKFEQEDYVLAMKELRERTELFGDKVEITLGLFLRILNSIDEISHNNLLSSAFVMHIMNHDFDKAKVAMEELEVRFKTLDKEVKEITTIAITNVIVAREGAAHD